MGLRAIGPTLSLRGLVELFSHDDGAPVARAVERLCELVERFDELTRLRLAAADMKLTVLAARDLASRRHEGMSDLDRVLETGLVTTYARCYLPTSAGGIGGRWRPAGSSDRQLHDRLIDTLRHPQHAHTDLGGARRLVRTARDSAGAPSIEAALDPNQSFERIEYLELFAGIGTDELESIADLAERQRARLFAAANELAETLGERRDP
jgi:hypothetical protein